MNSNTSEEAKMIELEQEFTDFLIKRIGRGFIKLQYITEQLNYLRPEVRNTLGSSESDILKFIAKHEDMFNIDHDIVSLVNNSVTDTHYDYNNKNAEDSLPNQISNGVGVIVKLHPTWGIINAKDPIKTSVYFSAKHFLLSYKEKVNLTDYGLKIGTMVKFNAAREKCENYPNFTTKYRAIKVWKKELDEENNIVHIPQKNYKTGLYDPMTYDGEGAILRVFLDFGFIAINGDKNNTVYFCKKNILNYDNIENLNKLFKKGDLVEFSAYRASRQDYRARWVAIKVWNKSGKIIKFKNQDENTTPKSVASITSSNQPVSLSESCSSNEHLTKNIMQNGTEKEVIYSEPGKICPRSNGAVIKFGENLSQLADGDSSVYYISGAEVTEISWEFTEGEDVKFDAVKIKSAPGWKAVLVWKGDKPNVAPPTYLEDFSEVTDYDEDDEFVEDALSSISGSQMSLSSHVSEKSFFSSEFNHSKSITSSEVNFKRQNLPFQRFSNSTNNDKICKRPDLPPFQYRSLNCISPSRESKTSDKSEYEKLTINDLNNASCKSVTNSKDMSMCQNNRLRISPFRNDEKGKLKTVSEYSSFPVNINDETKKRHSNHEFAESFDKSQKNYMKNIGISHSKISEINDRTNIKKFQDITGKIIKVYPKYARIQSSILPNPVTFYGRNFYSGKKSVQDLKDLKTILKVGDYVYFNYFEIVDDFGQTWNKVSLIWSGPKPLCYREKTIYEIIQQNNLIVTMNEPSSVQPKQQQQIVKSSVTTVDESSSFEGRTDGCISRTESYSDGGAEDSNNLFHSHLPSGIPDKQEKTLTDNIKVFLDLIDQTFITNKILFNDSKVDVNSLSAEISNLALKRLKEPSDDVDIVPEKQFVNNTSDAACSCVMEMAEKSAQTDNTKDTDVQTTFTIRNAFHIIIFAVLCFLLLKDFSEY